MFGKIRPEFQCLDRLGYNSHVSNDKAKILMSGKIRSEFQSFEG